MREAVRYTNKNLKWTAGDVKRQTDSHANALLEFGFKSGDTIAVWLPESAEKNITFLAAAKIGIKIADIDISITNVEDVRNFLKTTNCKAIYFEPVSETQDNLLLLRKAIPEFYSYDDTCGQTFHSKHFPRLKYFIHTGFDIEIGCANFKSLFLPNPEINTVDTLAADLTDQTPLYQKVKKGTKGGELDYGPVITHGEVLQSLDEEWAYAKKLVSQTYFEY